MRAFKKKLSCIIKNETGQALPIVLAMMVLGGLTLVPTLNFASTNIEAGKLAETKAKAIYAAEAGAADAMWRIKYANPGTFPYSYQLTDVNGLSANVTINAVTVIAGQEIGPTGVHGGWLHIDKGVTYSAGVYNYTLSFTNNGEGNMRIDEMLIDFPSLPEYITGSTTGLVTTVDPLVVGAADVGITLYWNLQPDYYIINKGDTATHIFQLSGPPDVQGIEGHAVVKATREDVGTVWDADSRPYSITSQAIGSSGRVLATLKVGIWAGSHIEISCWQVNP